MNCCRLRRLVFISIAALSSILFCEVIISCLFNLKVWGIDTISFYLQGLVHQLHIRHDDRNIFKIETFGFVTGGVMNITVTNFVVLLTLKEKAEQDREREKALSTPEPTLPPQSVVPSENDGEKEKSSGTEEKKSSDLEKSPPEAETSKQERSEIKKEKEKEREAEHEKYKEEKEKEKEKEREKDKDKDNDKGASSTKSETIVDSSPEKEVASESKNKDSASKDTLHQKPVGKEIAPKPIRSGEHPDRKEKDKDKEREKKEHSNANDGSQSSEEGRRALSDAASAYKIGFLLRRAPSESAAQQDLERIIERGPTTPSIYCQSASF